MAAGPFDALIRYSNRQIGAIIPDVAIEEAHQDRLVVTPHPIEGGGFASDHAYKLNPIVEMKVGFSDSSAGQVGYSRDRYDAVRRIQDAKQLISVSTGKRLYKNMLPVGVSVVTDMRTENSLIAVLALEQLTIVQTQTAAGGGDPATTSSVGDGAPAANQPVTDGGNVETQGVGSQAFAGAYNPGSASPMSPGGYQVDGNAATGSLGLGGINSPAASAVDPGQMTGLSPATEITLPEISVSTAQVAGGLEASGPDQYHMFGGGP